MISSVLEVYKSALAINNLGIPESVLRKYIAHVGVLLANLIQVPRDCDRLDDAFDPELLRDDHGGLLPDDERGPVRVRADVSRRDGQVGNFEPAHSVHVQLRVDDAALLARLHRAGAELIHDRKRKRKRTRKLHVVNDGHSALCRGGRSSPSARSWPLPPRDKKTNE